MKYTFLAAREMICVDVLVTLVAMDPQTWEDCGCDLDLYEEV